MMTMMMVMISEETFGPRKKDSKIWNMIPKAKVMNVKVKILGSQQSKGKSHVPGKELRLTI